MTTAIAAASAPLVGVAAAWNARGYTSLRLEDHAPRRWRGARWMDFAVTVDEPAAGVTRRVRAQNVGASP